MQNSPEKQRGKGKSDRGLIFDNIKLNPITCAIAASTVIFFACSSLRHALFQSTAFDLGYFDQALYLISKGQPPIVSFWGFHVMGGHADWVLYPLSVLYKIYPDVRGLFAVQAFALAVGALPTWKLARLAGLKEADAVAIAVAYLLYPLVFNINIFDFHPEVMALPALLGAILAARLNRPGWFSLAIVFILGCKAVLSLTVAAMGVWLLVFEKKRLCGAIAIFVGVAWFAIATQIIIPFFRPNGVEAVWRYQYLGNSVIEIAKNLLLKPDLLLSKVISLDSVQYLTLLVLPLIWGLSPQHLAPLVGALPAVVLNILAEHAPQRTLKHQYSVPILPFLVVSAIATLAAGRGWLPNRRLMLLWSLLAFLWLAKYDRFWNYFTTLDTGQATREAIAHIQPQASVLTDNFLAPHLTHRRIIKLIGHPSFLPVDLEEPEYILLNLRHCWPATQEVAANLVNNLNHAPQFKLSYQRDEVYLFQRIRRD